MNNQTMGSKPVFPLLMKMALPPMISMLIQSLYNIVDSMYVASISEEALTAVSLAFPLQNLSLAFSVGLGVAVNAHIAKNLGANKPERVHSYIFHGFLLTAIHSILFVLIGLFFVPHFFTFFSDNPVVINHAINYSSIVICLTFGSMFHILIEKIFQSTGNMIIPMCMQATGALINIVLDPILIFGYFGMPALGVTGAAIATVTGQLTACLLAIILFKKQSSPLELQIQKVDFLIIKRIYSIAIPSGALMSLPSILVSLLNSILASFSQSAVAFFGIYYKMQTFIYMPANGLIQGMRPLVSFNYGANNKDRVYSIIKLSTLTISIILGIGTILFFGFPTFILQCFSASDSLLKIGVPGLRILSFSFICSSVALTMCGVFESLGKGNYSLGISLFRQFVILLPVGYFISPIIGIHSIWIAFVISEVIASLYALFLFNKIHLFQKDAH